MQNFVFFYFDASSLGKRVLLTFLLIELQFSFLKLGQSRALFVFSAFQFLIQSIENKIGFHL